MYEFRCEQNHTAENYIDEEVTTISCPTCQCESLRVISAPRIALEGITGDFPTAADALGKEARRSNKNCQQAQRGLASGDIF